MKKIIRYFSFFTVFVSKTEAQQSLFNVPSVSITRKKEFFFQEQINITSGGNSLNFNTAYGFGKNFEVGMNLIGVGVGLDSKNQPVLITNTSRTNKQSYSPLVMITALKAFPIGEHINIGVGTQIGLNPTLGNFTAGDIATFNYVNTRFDVPHTRLMICMGAYYSNLIYLGQREQAGPILGFEYVIVEHKFLLMGDWIMGKNSAAVAVPGFVYHPHHNVALSLGWQIPHPGSGNPQGFVFELTLGNFSSK